MLLEFVVCKSCWITEDIYHTREKFSTKCILHGETAG